jgi:hypothetical protein
LTLAASVFLVVSTMPSTKDFRYFDFPGNTLNIIGTLLAGVCFHFVALVVYRLYIHPLAHFPGPKLAAATGWYEAFYQLFSGPQGGQFIFVIEELHKKYGNNNHLKKLYSQEFNHF